MIVTYIDKNGKIRTARFIERVNNLVKWRKNCQPSFASRYLLDDHSIVQIPDDAWELVTVISRTSEGDKKK
jgi:hypothetical protein